MWNGNLITKDVKYLAKKDAILEEKQTGTSDCKFHLLSCSLIGVLCVEKNFFQQSY